MTKFVVPTKVDQIAEELAELTLPILVPKDIVVPEAVPIIKAP